MEWQEILDKFKKDANGYIDYGIERDVGALLGAVESILEKLAKDEAEAKNPPYCACDEYGKFVREQIDKEIK